MSILRMIHSPARRRLVRHHRSRACCSMPFPDAALASMRRNIGLITRSQLRAMGVARSTIDGWVERGTLERVELGVYRQPGTAVLDEQRLRAAVYRAGEGARATGPSACALYGLEGFDLRSRPWIVIPPERRVRGVDFVVQRTPLAPGDLATVKRVPSVTPVRAVIEAARVVGARRLRVGIDDARRRGIVDLERLLRRAVELGRHPGAATVRALFGGGLLDQDGELERQLALLLARLGLQPTWGMEVLPGIIADACFPEASYILECDGREWHTIDSDRAADITREAVLRADGWHVDRVTSADLSRDTEAVVTAIRDRRAARVAAGLGRPGGWRPARAGRRLRPLRTAGPR